MIVGFAPFHVGQQRCRQVIGQALMFDTDTSRCAVQLIMWHAR